MNLVVKRGVRDLGYCSGRVERQRGAEKGEEEGRRDGPEGVWKEGGRGSLRSSIWRRGPSPMTCDRGSVTHSEEWKDRQDLTCS